MSLSIYGALTQLIAGGSLAFPAKDTPSPWVCSMICPVTLSLPSIPSQISKSDKYGFALYLESGTTVLTSYMLSTCSRSVLHREPAAPVWSLIAEYGIDGVFLVDIGGVFLVDLAKPDSMYWLWLVCEAHGRNCRKC